MELDKIINGVSVPSPQDTMAHFEYRAERLVAAVVTQTFSYMVENGLSYSYVTTGEAFVFLHVRLDDPTILYYHVAEPNGDVETRTTLWGSSFHTAVNQVLTFCLMALKSGWRDRKERNQEWRKSATQCLKTWDQTVCSHGVGGEPGDTNTLSKSRYRETCKGSASSGPGWSQTKSQAQNYCTQTCLLGLAQGDVLDRSCPNVLLHRVGGDDIRHAINREDFGRLVREQLGQNMDQGCEAMGKQGARGVLFKMTLASHGYTFVGKGTVPVFVRDLQHEGRIYQKLKRVQGVSVPVYLGNIDLIHRYFYDMGVQIVHMLLMSWAGEVAEDGDTADLKGEVQRSVQDLYKERVIHNDVRQPNILWNLERRRAMLVDFERAVALDDRKRQVLSHIAVEC